MALKKPDDTKQAPVKAEGTELTAEQIEAARVAEEARLAEEAAAAEEARLAEEAAAAEEARLAEEAAAAEEARLADEAAAAEEAERLEREANVSGKNKEQVLVKVKNLRKTAFRQPSTGKWIEGGQTEHLLHDGWLNNQIKRRLMELKED